MTDPITPAPITPDEYRTAAKVLRTNEARGWLGSHTAFSAVWCDKQAARLEAESARDEEAERLARAIFEGTAGHFVTGSTWEVAGDYSRNAFRAAARTALDFLAADGRLLPEGGTVPDVKPIGWYRTMTPTFATEHFDFPIPTAEKHVAEDGGKWVFDGQLEQWELREYPPAASVPDGGPDGTPEKPWPTAADVPDGTWFRTARLPDAKYRWLRCGKNSTDYADMADPKPMAAGFQIWDVSAVNDFAPFVRVDGDKA